MSQTEFTSLLTSVGLYVAPPPTLSAMSQRCDTLELTV